nr:GntR family transcriptional regulator [uncultured Agrococcus sp.]
MRIRLGDSGSPAEQIYNQVRGLISTGRLLADERLPSVRQLASDLGVAPGTVARAYRALEADGLVKSRTGAGTRVSASASSTPRAVLEHARGLAQASAREGVEFEEAVRTLRALWHDDAT